LFLVGVEYGEPVQRGALNSERGTGDDQDDTSELE
jgi:hypothetical protein